MDTTENTAAVSTVEAVKYQHPATSWYADLLKAWPRDAGKKPTLSLLAMSHLLDRKKRPGVEMLHIAMALREGGCTVRQFLLAGNCGPANNYRRSLVNAGLVKCTVEGKPYAYVLTVTPKGEKAIAKAIDALASEAANTKPAKATKKAAGKRKPVAAAIPAKPETPTSDVPTVTEGHVTVDQPEMVTA
jgi:hypothetical protein